MLQSRKYVVSSVEQFVPCAAAVLPVPARGARGVAGRRAQQARRVRGLPRGALHGALLRRAAAQSTITIYYLY